MSRPGIIIRGEVVMSPSYVDTTGPMGRNNGMWILGSKIYVNDRLRSDVVAYDEVEGVALVQTDNGDGTGFAQMVRGHVRAIPRRPLT